MTEVTQDPKGTDPKRRYAPRKIAQQARSRETVDRILAGAWQILAAKGAKALTTRSVAEESGVNIASIYQFFPNKQAILHKLYVSRLEDVMAVFDRLERPENFALDLLTWMRLSSASFDKLGWSDAAQLELEQACSIDRELRLVALAHIARVEQRVTDIFQRFLPDADPSFVRLLSRFVYGMERMEVGMFATEAVEMKPIIREWKEDLFRVLIEKVDRADFSESPVRDARSPA